MSTVVSHDLMCVCVNMCFESEATGSFARRGCKKSNSFQFLLTPQDNHHFSFIGNSAATVKALGLVPHVSKMTSWKQNTIMCEGLKK